jgi:hypothetical protein
MKIYKLHILEGGLTGGFYCDDIHNNIPFPCIEVNEDLWIYLLTLNQFRFNGKIENRVLDINDVWLFEKTNEQPINFEY